MKCFDEAYRGRRVLVTGHTGFKGSWLALWLKALGAEVAGFSLDIPTTPSNFNILDLENSIEHHLGDIRDINFLGKVIDEFRPHIIFHLAAQALVGQSYEDPRNTFEINVMGMVNILDCIRHRPWLKAAVLITSDKAYRNLEWCWGYRESDILGGSDPYSASKSCADLIAQSYFDSYMKNGPTKIAITRAGNVIGGGDWADSRIVPDCMRAWSNLELVRLRNPGATRPWQHVLEPLSGYLLLGSNLINESSKLNGEAFNFGPDDSVNQSVLELIQAMSIRWRNVAWEIPKGDDNSPHEAKLLKLSCDKAQSLLKWRATLRFSETVNFTVDWYKYWNENKQNMSDFSINQIVTYSELAQSRGALWVTL